MSTAAAEDLRKTKLIQWNFWKKLYQFMDRDNVCFRKSYYHHAFDYLISSIISSKHWTSPCMFSWEFSEIFRTPISKNTPARLLIYGYSWLHSIFIKRLSIKSRRKSNSLPGILSFLSTTSSLWNA